MLCSFLPSLYPLSKSFKFERYTETMLLAQFKQDIYPVEKITLKYVTANVFTHRYKLRVLRFRLTPLKIGLRYTHPHTPTHTEPCSSHCVFVLSNHSSPFVSRFRPMCRYDLLLEENKEVTFRPIPCHDSNF